MKITRLLTVAFAATLSLGARADGYVTLTANSSTSKGFAGASWSETVDDPSTRDYLAAGGYTFYTTQNEVINAKSLTLGIVGGSECIFFAYYSATFNNGGVIFATGEAYPRASQDTFSGKTTFTSPSTAPFRFHGTNYRPVGFTFAGDVHSIATAGILAYSQGTNGFHVTFSGDTSDYLGSVVITSRYDGAGAPYGAELRLSGSASTFGGSIVVRDGATFRPQIATSVGSLTLDPGSSLSLVAGKTLTVSAGLDVNGGPVPIALSGAPSAEVAEVTRYALITMPADSACTEADFSLPNYGSNFRTAPHLYMETSGETKTLYAAYYPTVSLTTKNNGTGIGDTATGSAVTNGAYWSDGEPVHGFAHYLVSRISGTTGILTPYAPDETMVFPGRSLRFGEYTQIAIRTGDYTISNLYFNCGSNGSTVFGLNERDVTLRGKFSVNANGIVSYFENHGLQVDNIDLGGGLGVDYYNPDSHAIPEFGLWFQTLTENLRHRPDQRIHVEPGRALVAQCASLVSRVIFVKDGERKSFVILDAGMNDLLRPALYGAYHKIENLTYDSDELRLYDVVGPVCETTDLFAEDRTLPLTRRGDLVALRSAGAYGAVMSSTYNMREPARAVFSDQPAE